MDPTVTAAAMPVAGSRPKKQPKARKPAKDLMPDEQRKESEKCAGWHEAVKTRQNATRLEEERRKRLSGSSPRKPWPTARSWLARPPCASS
jgi:hypothetical protein